MSTNYDNQKLRSAGEILQLQFKKHPVLTIENLSKSLKSTERTVFRALKEMDYLSSYSHAGKFYTLRTIPSFNSNGLWFHHDVGFSKYGNLRSTIIVFVKEAPAGYTHEELQAILQLRVHNTLADLVRANLINREQVDAVYVYVDANPKTAKTQIEKRRVMVEVPRSEERQLDMASVVEILLVVIHKQKVSVPLIRAILGAKGIVASDREIEGVLDRYDLKKKIKNSPSRYSQK